MIHAIVGAIAMGLVLGGFIVGAVLLLEPLIKRKK
jgi:hypothetical protein